MRCIVDSCRNNQDVKNELLSFHKFPYILDIKNKWISSLKLEANLVNTRSVVCSRHFFDKDFIGVSKNHRRLFPSAIPHLNADDDESIDLAALIINKRVETVLAEIEDTDEENIHITENIQIVSPKNQNIDKYAHTIHNFQDAYLRLLHSLPVASSVVTKRVLENNGKLIPSSPRKKAAGCKLKDLKKTVTEKSRKIKTKKVIAKKALETSDELITSSPRKIAVKCKMLYQKKAVVEKEKVLGKKTLKSSDEFQSSSSPNKKAAANKLKNPKIEAHPNDNAQNDSSLILNSLAFKNKVSTKRALESLIKEMKSSPKKGNYQDETKNKTNYTQNDSSLFSNPLPIANKVSSKRALESLTIQSLKCSDELPSSPPRISAIENKPSNQYIKSETNQNVSLLFANPLPVANKVSSKITLESLFKETLETSDETSSTTKKEASPDKLRNQMTESCINDNISTLIIVDDSDSTNRALKTSDILLSSSSRKRAGQDEIRCLQHRVAKKNIKIKALNQKVRRQTKRIETLTKTIKQIKSSNFINKEISDILQKCLRGK